MIPYQGSKRRHAKEILEKIPSADNFYDLFGGGGSVTTAAVEEGRWQTCTYNEINTGVCKLFEAIITETFDFEEAESKWVTREEFFESSRNCQTAWDGYVATGWSFGNSLDSYVYGKEIELAKMICFALVTYDNPLMPNTTINDRRLMLLRAINSLIERNPRLAELKRVNGLQTLTRSNLMKKTPIRDELRAVKVTNQDYKDVTITNNSVVYCDIPYSGGGADPKSYNLNFNRDEFLDWAATRDFPVYVSEYEITDPRFQCVWEKDVRTTFSAQSNSTQRTERLYWNGVGTSLFP